MDIKFYGHNDDPHIDIGVDGHTITMHVYQKKAAAALQPKPGDSRAYFGHNLPPDAIIVAFSSSANGSGRWLIVPMTPTAAAQYPIGSVATLHYRNAQVIGCGELVAITHGQAEHAPE